MMRRIQRRRDEEAVLFDLLFPHSTGVPGVILFFFFFWLLTIHSFTCLNVYLDSVGSA